MKKAEFVLIIAAISFTYVLNAHHALAELTVTSELQGGTSTSFNSEPSHQRAYGRRGKNDCHADVWPGLQF